MGSKSSSTSKSQSVSTNIDQTTNQADYSVGDGARTTTSTSGNNNTTTITATDFGAIEGGLSVARDSVAAIAGSQKTALDFGADAITKSLEFANQQSDRSISAVKALSVQQEKSATDTMQTLMAVTENVKTEGQTLTVKLLAGVTVALIGAAAVVAVIVSKGRKS